MVKALHIVGTRPQTIKAAALSRQIRTRFSDAIEEVLVDTGQHYDRELSAVFFHELQLPEPQYNLKIGSGSHGNQTARILTGIEWVLNAEKPHCVVVYGDTNSTLASSLASVKMGYPVVHIEAGLRSFIKKMPEEVNRIVCDHISTLLFTPTKAGMENLEREGLPVGNAPPYTADNPGIFHCGDIMYDNSIYFGKTVMVRKELLEKFSIGQGQYILATVHRNTNTDNTDRLEAIFEGLLRITRKGQFTVIFPIHPRTMQAVKTTMPRLFLEKIKKNISLIPPVSYLEMIALEKHAKMIITDSGGVQKEAHFFEKPCIVLRPETEWVELVNNNTALLADADSRRILDAYEYFLSDRDLSFPPFYGDGKSAEFICRELVSAFH
jgi:UDP-GlcNAc3NAcA epimerase